MDNTFRTIFMGAAGTSAGGDLPVGVDFDGTNDYLSRSSDLVGNTDSKTFTFSCWVHSPLTGYDVYNVGNSKTVVQVRNTGFQLLMQNSSGTYVLRAVTPLPKNTFLHLIVSVDLSNPSNRYIYINDVEASVTWTAYTNSAINFTESGVGIAARSLDGQNRYKGRLAGVYLDYTYRDLSVEANRRDFIGADGLYVTPPTTGIISVPMDDPDDVGRNDGTGGNFTLNGTVARSGRGPNQYNTAASTFDGSNDYLRKTSALTSATDTNKLTTSFTVKLGDSGNSRYIFNNESGGQKIAINLNSSRLSLQVKSSTNVFLTNVLVYEVNTQDKFYSVNISFDLSDTSKRHVFVNGVEVSATWNTTYTNGLIKFDGTAFDVGSFEGEFALFLGDLGEFYLDNTYIDLATENPFYDADTNKPKYLGQSGELPTGSSPLIYLPLRADGAGNNLGTGGDFGVNSGPYVGARGASEFIARSAEFNGSTQYLRRSNITGMSDSSDVTCVASFTVDSASGTGGIVTIGEVIGDGNKGFRLIQSGNDVSTNFALGYGALAVNNLLVTGSWFTAMYSTRSGKQYLYLYKDGDLVGSATNSATYSTPDITTSQNYIGRLQNEFEHDGQIGCVWFDTTFIDFSQEANRLLFMDDFGYPANVGADGSIPTGNSPLVFINNNFHLGTNSGTGGNYTPTNAPTAGPDVKG